VNLCILIGHFPPGAFGGAELQAERWAQRLAARHHVTVVTRRDPPALPESERRDGFVVRRLPVSRLPLLRTALDLAAIEHAVGGIAPRPDLLLCFQTFISGLAGTRIQRRTGIPALVWVRGEAEYRLSDSPLTRWLSPRVWGEARAVLVQSEENRAALLAELARRAPAVRAAVERKLEVVPNGLDLPEPPFAPGAGVLVVGRLIREKAVDVVVDAVAGLTGRLTVAGDGPERARLEQCARRLGVDARFEGHVSSARLAMLYREAACVVLASRRGEGLPNALLEAFAYARPVVATPVAGVRDLVADGVNGLLCPCGDARALRECLARLSNEPGLPGRLGAAARATAERFTWDRVEPLLEAALERWRAR
jgi:glycosyltransferase involved in cell wall biosynthesis